MGDHNLKVFPFVLLIVAAFGVNTTFGIEPCSETIRNVCDCLFYPFFTVRCTHKSLYEYPDLKTIQSSIRKLDVSYNNLRKFPPNIDRFSTLETLDLSYNRIDFIPNDVIFPDDLRHLILSYNNISDWASLNPNTFLESAINLEILNLAGNPLGAYNGVDDRLLLVSSSLKTLDLSNCQISQISGSLMLSGLDNLERLILSSNPLYTLPDMQAFSLTSLDVSGCKLAMLRRTVFAQMPQLTIVNFSENHRLTLIQRSGESVESVSLRQIDLSMCNMNAVELSGFPNLTTANLSGNLITALTEDTFQNNILLESLDLSSNAISRISIMAFQWLDRLRILDLSLNMIRQIEPETFADNMQLVSINLSRNFIDRFRSFTSRSIRYLNLSRCEITRIDSDAIDDLSELIELDLSYNWFSELPVEFGSSSLQILDLSRCRLSTIDNSTFSTFPDLSRLNLAGNRLTTTFCKDYFANNQYLNEIWLGDNPWRCECDRMSHDFFLYITERPARLKDRTQLRCYSTGNANGVLWEVGCSDYWDGPTRRIGAAEKVWTMAMGIIIAIAILYSVIYGVKWWAQYRKETREEHQRQENLETTRELMRNNQMVLEQQGQLNAPDPRESHPPCYADAIMMPRPKKSFTSLKLSSLADNDNQNKRGAKRTRSEELLGAIGSETAQRPILTAHSRKNLLQPWTTANQGDSSTSLIKNDSAIENGSSQKSFEIIAHLETEGGHSPYAKRKPLAYDEELKRFASSDESIDHQEYTNEENDMPIYQNCNQIGLVHNESPHTSQSFFAPKIPPYPYTISSSSSFSSSTSVDSDEYIQLSQSKSFSSKHSDV